MTNKQIKYNNSQVFPSPVKMNRRTTNGVSAVDCDAAILQLGEGIVLYFCPYINVWLSFLDFNSTHCLMNAEVKLLLESYIQKRIDESCTIPFNQPTAYTLIIWIPCA